MPASNQSGGTPTPEGELVALRWRDVDWSASVIRVRRNYTRGRLGTPKSKRSSQALPMADRLGGELDRHFKRSLYQGDDHLVFCHPQTGDLRRLAGAQARALCLLQLLRQHHYQPAASTVGGGEGPFDVNHYTQLVLEQAKALYRYWPEVEGRLFE